MLLHQRIQINSDCKGVCDEEIALDKTRKEKNVSIEMKAFEGV